MYPAMLRPNGIDCTRNGDKPGAHQPRNKPHAAPADAVHQVRQAHVARNQAVEDQPSDQVRQRKDAIRQTPWAWSLYFPPLTHAAIGSYSVMAIAVAINASPTEIKPLSSPWM